MNNYFPHFLAGLITGACIGFAALMEYIMRTREPHYHAADPQTDPTPPPDVEFDTRMSNEEWIDAAIADALRKAGI